MTQISELWRLGASQVAELVCTRQVSAVEVAQSALARLAAVNPALNAVVEHRPGEILAHAASIDEAIARGRPPSPLAGVCVTTKKPILPIDPLPA